MAQLTLRGDDALIRSLDALPGKVVRRVARGAVRRGLTPILNSARSKVPQQKRIGNRGRKVMGLLRKSLGQGKVITRKDGSVSGAIGPRTDDKYSIAENGRITRPSSYAHFSERGVKGGPRQFSGKRWMQAAFDGNKRLAIRTVRKAMLEGVELWAKKLRLSGGR